MPQFDLKLVFSLALRVTLAILFLLSFATKIGDLEPIEMAMVDVGITNWTLAPYFSRFILSVELALAIGFLFNLVRKWTFWGAVSLLVVFSAYLIYIYFKDGNEGDCGCFGAFLELNPLESFAKNIVMIGLVILWFVYSKEEWKWKPTVVVSALAAVVLTLPYILNTPFYENQEYENLKVVNYPLDTELLGPMTFSDSTKPDLKKGEYILAFLSLKCKHCLNTAQKLAILQKMVKMPVIYSVFIGKRDRIPAFEKTSKSSFPYYVYPDQKLMRITGPEYPVVFYIKDGIVVKKWNYITLTQEEIEGTFNQK